MIFLSFDIEEFDAPEDFGHKVEIAEQFAVSQKGCRALLELLSAEAVPATFFSTLKFAEGSRDIIAQLLADGHELASHGVEHSYFEERHLFESKQGLEQLAQQLGYAIEVKGFRMPRMQAVDKSALAEAGYRYDASLNPTWIPSRYNHLNKPTKPFMDEADILQLPASVTPRLRVPLFWLLFHNLPESLFLWLVRKTYQKQGYLNIYFHPWEFADLANEPSARQLPFYMKRNTGHGAIKRLYRLICSLKTINAPFATLQEYRLDTTSPTDNGKG